MTDAPLISVIIPCFNAQSWVEAAVRSVVDQGRADVEIVVIDDGSTDDSVGVLRSLEPIIRWETGPNKGACTARNRGLELARGSFVLFLDADDYLQPGFLDELAAQTATGVDLVVGGHVIEDASGTIIADRRWPSTVSQADLMLLNIAEPLQTGAFLWRRQFVRDYHGWDTSLPIAQDTEFALRMVSFAPRFAIATDGVAHVVWRAVGGDARITTRMTDAKLKALLGVFERHRPMLTSYGDARIDQALATRFYALARIAYAYGNDAIGRTAEAAARAIGLPRAPEHGANAALTRMMGLRRKTKLLASLYSVRYRGRPSARPYPYNLAPSRS